MDCVVITGSRGWIDVGAIVARLGQEPADTVFIEGGCQTGADAIAREWCWREQRNHIQVRANWELYGRSAGAIRNGWMLDMRPRLVLAFWRDGSPGTKDCMDQARRRKIPVEEFLP